jgi:hypothetical protein
MVLYNNKNSKRDKKHRNVTKQNYEWYQKIHNYLISVFLKAKPKVAESFTPKEAHYK